MWIIELKEVGAKEKRKSWKGRDTKGNEVRGKEKGVNG